MIKCTNCDGEIDEGKYLVIFRTEEGFRMVIGCVTHHPISTEGALGVVGSSLCLAELIDAELAPVIVQ